MSGFEKIELPQASKIAARDQKRSNMSSKKRKLRFTKPAFITLVILVIFIVLTIFFVVIPAKKTYTLAMQTVAKEKQFVSAIKGQNIALASDELDKTKTSLSQTQQSLHKISFLGFIPVVNWYYNDANHLLNADSYGLNAAGIVVDSLKPYADVLGLKGGSSFVGGSAEERIKTAVLTMGKITPRIDDISKALVQTKQEIDGVKPWHYPKVLFGNKIETELSQAVDLTDQAAQFVNQSRPLIKVFPSLLGETSAKKYLILFQNDKELRPTGGFITGYSIFSINEGVIQADRSGDIYTLDDSIADKPPAPAPLQKYLQVYTFNLRDSNLSPDFITSMKQFQHFYDESTMKVNVDGIIAIDTYVLVKTISDLDHQVTSDGITFTDQNDPRCNCPQVIYELENNISRPVNYIKTDRKSLLGSLLTTILQKALSSSPKKYWGALFQDMIALTNQKHILFDLNDTNAQSGLEALNAAGQIKNFDGDYLHINETNFSGAKTNLFVSEAVSTNYQTKSDGTITKTITINYKDPFAPSDCSLATGGLCLNAEYRDWIRIYVPKGSTLISSTGSEVKLTTYEDLGYTVFDGLVSVRPMGVATYTISYTLPFKVSGNSLPVLIQKQPGTDGNAYTLSVNGNQQQEFQLYADKQTKINL